MTLGSHAVDRDLLPALCGGGVGRPFLEPPDPAHRGSACPWSPGVLSSPDTDPTGLHGPQMPGPPRKGLVRPQEPSSWCDWHLGTAVCRPCGTNVGLGRRAFQRPVPDSFPFPQASKVWTGARVQEVGPSASSLGPRPEASQGFSTSLSAEAPAGGGVVGQLGPSRGQSPPHLGPGHPCPLWSGLPTTMAKGELDLRWVTTQDGVSVHLGGFLGSSLSAVPPQPVSPRGGPGPSAVSAFRLRGPSCGVPLTGSPLEGSPCWVFSGGLSGYACLCGVFQGGPCCRVRESGTLCGGSR